MGTLADHKALEDDTFLETVSSCRVQHFSILYLSLRILRMLLHSDIKMELHTPFSTGTLEMQKKAVR
jgi:hypothetical protein